MGNFRALDMYVDGFPGYVHLLPVLASCLELICELQEVGQDIYYRLDDSKVQAWLCCNVKENADKPHNLHLLKPDKCAATFGEMGCDGLWKGVSLCSYLHPPLLHWFSHQVPIGDSWRPPDKCSRPVQNLAP
ncbi:unnamed protein product [Sphagnum balticum]